MRLARRWHESRCSMSKKIVVVNAGPRKGWNTDTLLTEAARGAQERGAEILRFDLFRLEMQKAYDLGAALI